MRVRVPIEKHSTADEHQQKMMTLYKKFNLHHNKHHNDISEENEEENNETEESSREETDLEILGVSKADHPCVDEVLVEKQACGMRNKPCEYEIYGVPRKRPFTQFNHVNLYLIYLQAFCLLEPKAGACRTQAENRWYYDKLSQDCHIFPYTGCHGNKNNFETQELCQQTCTRKPLM